MKDNETNYAIEILERERWAMRGYIDRLQRVAHEGCFSHPEIPNAEARLAQIEAALVRLRGLTP
jgi:hypothetical protein